MSEQAVRELLDRWDRGSNPIYRSAAGQMRHALRVAPATVRDRRMAEPLPTRPGDVRGTDHTKETGDE